MKKLPILDTNKEGDVILKRKYLYISSFFIVVSIFSLVFAFSYKLTKNRDNYGSPKPSPTSASEQADTTSEVRVTDKTIYELEVLQISTDRIVSQNESVPAEFAGKTREELLQYLEHYMDNLPLEESLNGLISFELISFSKEKIVLRKTYQDQAKENKYFLTLAGSEVVVYYNDKKTVYEYTGITTEQLSTEEIAALTIGYYVEGEEQLFGILENYSS